MGEYDEQALRADANQHWQPWSIELEGWKDQLHEAPLTRQDFSLAPGSGELFAAFQKRISNIAEYIHTGEEVFEGIARALLDASIDYMEMEDYAETEIDRVEQEMAEL